MSIAAIIVAYHPSPSIREHVALIREQINNVTVVDNGGTAELEVPVIRNSANLGIAAALNIGIARSKADWILLFDQDSRITPGYIEAMGAKIAPDVGIIGPKYIDSRNGMEVGPCAVNGELPTTMTSGSMISGEAFRKAGPFEESFFIDLVDTEYSLRLRRYGYRLVQADAVLYHSLGEPLNKFGLHSASHAAGRVYYITRNRLVVLRRYGLHFPRWALEESLAALRAPIKLAFFEDDSLQKLRMWAAGIRDAVCSRMGQRVTL